MTHHQNPSPLRDKLEPILHKYPGARREYLIPLLQDVQEKLDYLPAEAIDIVAQHLGLTAAKVFGVATFYNQFRLNAPGRFRISICRGTACHVIGSATLLQHLESELNIKAGETTKDGLFSLEVVACLGACSMAPVMMVNNEFHGKLTARAITRILKDLRNKATQDAAASASEGA